MRILHVTDGFPPDMGGREQSIAALTRHRAGQGHDVTVLTVQHEGEPADSLVHGVRVLRRPMMLDRVPAYAGSHRFHPPAPDPIFQRALRRIIEEWRPDIIHVHDWTLHSVMPVAKRHRIPVIATAHDYGHLCGLKTLDRGGTSCEGPRLSRCLPCSASHYGSVRGPVIATGLLSGLHRNADVTRWTALSSDGADRGSSIDRWNRPMTVIPSFVPDDEVVDPAAVDRPAFAPRGDYIMFAGQLSRHKGVHVLMEAYRRLRTTLGEKAPDLLLLGMLKDDSPEVEGPGVTVVANVPHAEVMAAWAHCDVAVVPSTWSEPFGKVAVEAGLLGKPVIASRVGGLPDIVVDSHTGFLVPPGDADALHARLVILATQPRVRDELGAHAREHCRRFLLSGVADAYMRLYLEALGADQLAER